ncbi:uncharacterized protein FTOL_13756 [Fusarium torulosum]|uniref:Uncharacterized protein n=1 Tax=Fusarium torulosum TaxID=33205 RepID=A0AAE8SQI2_9HYPO|nr:uncharacterized protein FTOL_13756 [Fusarium torulosum]
MDSSEDKCRKGFTVGQRHRMHSSYEFYRSHEYPYYDLNLYMFIRVF